MTFNEIKSAIKRSKSMGVYSPWQKDYDSHYLAACIDNYTWLLEGGNGRQEYLDDLLLISKMAEGINSFCEKNIVSDSPAAKYWLERYLWVVSRYQPVNLPVFLGMQ
jgi:hypothetical protein